MYNAFVLINTAGEIIVKLDKDYTYVQSCPVTEEDLTHDEFAYSGGVCPRCGNTTGDSLTHVMHLTGRYMRPNILEWLMGERATFVITKEKEWLLRR